MKALLLLIHSPSPIYNQMFLIQQQYVHAFDEIDTFFVVLRETQVNLVEQENDIIYVKGKEHVLNVLYKTITALEYLFQKNEYDFVIRSNISTIIHMKKLIQYLHTIPTTRIYTSSQFLNLQWLDPRVGIRNTSLFGTIFASGISITLSNDTVKDLINNKDKLRHDIVDDVSIGLFFQTYYPTILNEGTQYMSTELYTNTVINKNINVNNYIYFRNKCSNRTVDIQIMDLIVKKLYT
jgi:hypothetical protein